MKTRLILSLGLTALVMGGTMVGCTGATGGLASAGSRDARKAAQVAAVDARRATAALARGNAAGAVGDAEHAVALMPQNAAYRALLGQIYMKAGRFSSAKAAFGDALALESPDGAERGRVALNLALAQIALGDWQSARDTLAAASTTIPTTDRGLALALAGDPGAAVTLLTDVVRAGGASPKDRQNLALSLALGGQWQAARVVAAADMSPADVDRRMEEWASFAKPTGAADQVASLLGVKPTQDPGQPLALALAAPAPLGQAVAAADPAPANVALPAADLPPPPVATRDAPAEVATLRADPGVIKVSVAVPPRAVRAPRAPAPLPAPTPARGNWYVQVGAFTNAAVARDGWRRATHRMPTLANHTPTGAQFTASKAGPLYRLALGGFARADADGLCRRYRAIGGACFVRAAAGDRTALWARKPTVQLASR